MNPNPNANVDPQSPTTARTSSPPLQRGKACLSCRRRKMKCDGARPVCTPCLRGERSEDCEYTDGQRRPRTLVLEEDVARLRARLQELENPGEAVPSVQLHAPYASASSSTMRSASTGHVPVPASSNYHTGSMRQAQSSARSSGVSFSLIPDPTPLLGVVSDSHRTDSETEVYARDALSVIDPYAAELGFFLNLDRLRVQGTHVLPALQSALTLWCVHIKSTSEPDHAQTLERTQTLSSNLLRQTQTQLASALSIIDAEPDPAFFLQLIQTGVLLAYYMQRIGQVVGARYYASGTWALGMMLRLHRIPSLSGNANEEEPRSSRGGGVRDGPTRGHGSMCAFAWAGYTRLTQALDGIEAGERVRAFWAMYALDRWFSAVGQWPAQSLAVDGNEVTVPWPNVGPNMLGEARNVVRHLLNDPNHDFTQGGPSAMHAKASVLLGEAAAVAASYVANNAISQSSAFQARFGTLDTLLQRCLSAAITMATGRQSRGQGQGRGQVLVTVHLTAFAQAILHRPFISTSYRSSRRRCIEAAFGVIRVLDQMDEAGVRVANINPVYAGVWTGLCLTLHEEILRLRERPNADPSRSHEQSEMVGAIRKLMGILSVLSQRYPSRFFAVKIEALLPILESIAL